MLKNIKFHKLLFIDIETVPFSDNYDSLDEDWKEMWMKKAKWILKDGQSIEEVWFERAGIFAEFGKIVCISMAYFHSEEKELRLKSFYDNDEQKLLKEFSDVMNAHFSDLNRFSFCGHNVKEFDIPYISRRLVANSFGLPRMLNLHGFKPWEVNHLDTLELWKFGDRKNFTSLRMLTKLMDIPSPKSAMDGSDVASVYWKKKDLESIATYCQQDVIAVAQIIRKFMDQELIADDKIILP